MRRRLLPLIALLTALIALGSSTPASAAGDDYVYRSDTTQSADPWGFTKRQCVSFVAWRLKQYNKPINNSTQKWGNADHWDDTARARGVVVSTRPKVGAIAQWNRYEKSAYYGSGSSVANGTITAGGYGHVAYVVATYADGSVKIEQYNMSGNRSFSVMHVKAPRYLYLRG